MAITTVLLAVGSRDDERAGPLVEAAVELVEPTDGSVVLAHVFDEDEFTELRSLLADSGDGPVDTAAGRLELGPGADRGADLGPDEVANRLVAVRELAEGLAAAGVDGSVRGLVDRDPADGIVELAASVGADRIVVGGRRRSPAGKAVFGSVAQAVMLRAPCPVEFVRTD